MFELTTYLTEKSLGDILRAWAGPENVTPQPMVLGTRMRYDYLVTLPNETLFVEFDGDSHFRDANVIFRDDAKDKIAATLGRRVIRIPYFIQLTTETFSFFFGEGFDVATSFPHGFIAHKMLPSSFCPLGYARARSILDDAPSGVREAVLLSLVNKTKTLPPAFVFFAHTTF